MGINASIWNIVLEPTLWKHINIKCLWRSWYLAEDCCFGNLINVNSADLFSIYIRSICGGNSFEGMLCESVLCIRGEFKCARWIALFRSDEVQFFLTRPSYDKIEIVSSFRSAARKKWTLFSLARLSQQSAVGFSSAAEYKLIAPLSRVGDLVAFIAVTCSFSRHFYYFSA